MRWSVKYGRNRGHKTKQTYDGQRYFEKRATLGTICCLRHPYFIRFHHWNTVKCHVWKIYEKLFDMCNSLWAPFVLCESLVCECVICICECFVAFISFHLKMKISSHSRSLTCYLYVCNSRPKIYLVAFFFFLNIYFIYVIFLLLLI